jgi:hypothetical protein
MQLTYWEWEELREHFSGRPDIWAPADSTETKWYRSVDDVPLWVLLVTPPTGSGPFRMYTLQTIPIANVVPDLQRLVSGYTSYDTRLRVIDLLCSDLLLPVEKAQFAAVAFMHIVFTGEGVQVSSPEEEASQLNLPGFVRPDTDEHLGLWPLADNQGYVLLDLINNRLHADISIRGAQAGWSTILRGNVFPVSGTHINAAAAIAGWDLQSREQGELPGVLSDD